MAKPNKTEDKRIVPQKDVEFDLEMRPYRKLKDQADRDIELKQSADSQQSQPKMSLRRIAIAIIMLLNIGVVIFGIIAHTCREQLDQDLKNHNFTNVEILGTKVFLLVAGGGLLGFICNLVDLLRSKNQHQSTEKLVSRIYISYIATAAFLLIFLFWLLHSYYNTFMDWLF